MRVAMVSEGTYPHGHGGVSVWCDQLVHGMPEHSFELVALTASGTEPIVWKLPANVAAVRAVPLWGSQPRTLPLPLAEFFNRGRTRRADQIVLKFAAALMQPEFLHAKRDFYRVLRDWVDLAPEVDIEKALVSPTFVDFILRRWGSELLAGNVGRGMGAPTVADVVAAARMIAHAMRPLMVPPPHVDLVHLVANGLSGLVGLAAKIRYNTPFILSEHGIYLRERYLSFGNSTYSWPMKWLMLRFYRLLTSTVYQQAAIVAPGNIYNRRWERMEGVPNEIIRTVYNGVDPDEFAVAEQEPDLPTVAFVGRIDPIKDIETLIRSFPYVLTKVPHARLRIFGGTPKGREAYLETLKTVTSELGLDRCVSFEGRIDRIQDGYAAGSVIVLSSISEGFPYTVIEAMSCGRATVSTNVGGVAEAVGQAGLLVPPRNPEKLGAACAELLLDDQKRRRFAKESRLRVEEFFTLQRSIEALRALYDEAILMNREVGQGDVA